VRLLDAELDTLMLAKAREFIENTYSTMNQSTRLYEQSP
jgi:hypothetical protein